VAKKRKESADDPFDSFIRDMMDFLKKMDEELSDLFDDEVGSEFMDDEASYGFVGGDNLELEESVDVIELPDEVLVVMEIPGVRKEDISIRAKGMELIIKAKDLFKKVTLPIKVNPNKARATYRNGILEIKIKK